MWLIEFGLRTYFILKRNRFLTTVIFTGSAMIHAYSGEYSVSGIRS